jgi:lysophospholipase
MPMDPGGSFKTALLLFLLCVSALAQNQKEEYSPAKSKCPEAKSSLVRDAGRISDLERTYISQRTKHPKTGALTEWFESLSPKGSDLFSKAEIPLIAFSSSGGGYRSMLISAGVIQAMDNRDSKTAVSGLYQSVAYHAGLSGGSWLLGSLVGNGFETISTLSKELWEPGLEKNALSPLSPENLDASPDLARVKQDMLEKASLSPVVTDVWGRFLEFQTISQKPGRGLGKGIAHLFSDVKHLDAFKSYEMPFPIITALGVENINGSICDAPDNATAYEWSPYEFGSWDKGVKAFMSTEFLGTEMVDGQPSGECEKRLDQMSYIMGTSSAKFNEECGGSLLSVIYSALEPLVKPAQKPANDALSKRRNIFSPWQNPFFKRANSPKVSEYKELFLVDGGQANQNNPLWPLIQPQRGINVIIVSDNSADTDDNWPNGTEIRHTYDLAKSSGLTRMPWVPDANTFIANNLHKRASFFGCRNTNLTTIVFLPNTNYTSFESNPASSKFDYTKEETREMIKNGNLVATQGGDKEWPLCLACGIMHKRHTSQLPHECKACLEKYCVDEPRKKS